MDPNYKLDLAQEHGNHKRLYPGSQTGICSDRRISHRCSQLAACVHAV